MGVWHVVTSAWLIAGTARTARTPRLRAKMRRGVERPFANGTASVAAALSAILAAGAPLQAQQATPPAHDSEQPDVYAKEIDAALAAYNSDNYFAAREHFLKAHQLRPSARTWRGLGTTAFELKSYEDAIRELTFALEDRRNPLPPDLRAETDLTLRVARRRLADMRAANSQTANGDLAEESSPAQSPARARALEAWDSTQAPGEVEASAERPAPGAPEPPEPASAPNDAGLGAMRIAAIVAGSSGLVALAVGAGFGLQSMSKGRERDELCPAAQQPACSASAKDAADAAITAGNIATVALIAGGALLAGGVVLWVVGDAPESSTAPKARLSIGPAGLMMSGSF